MEVLKFEIRDDALYATDEHGTVYKFEGQAWVQLDEEGLQQLKSQEDEDIIEDGFGSA